MQLTERSFWALVVVVGLLLLPLFFYLDAKLVFVIGEVLFLALYYGLYKGKIEIYLFVAMLFGVFTNIINDYTYDTANYFVFGINIFSFFSWTTGLVLLREFYDRFEIQFKWFVFSVLYLVLLIFFEYVGFYYLDIRLAAGNPSLLGLGVIHGTLAMHIFYPLAGPVYLLITDALSKHVKKAKHSFS